MIVFTVLFDETTKQGSMMGNCTGQQAMNIIQNLIVSSAINTATEIARGNGEKQIAKIEPNNNQLKLL